MRSYKTGSTVPQKLHGGAGEAAVRDVLGRPDFETAFEFVKYVLLPPGGSIGLHRHMRSEECYVLVDGPLTVTGNGHSAVLVPPTVVRCRAGDAHGIFNHTSLPSGFIGLGVAPQDGPFDGIGLGDDLTNRTPGEPELVDAEFLDTASLSRVNAHRGLGEIAFRRVFSHEDFSTNWGFIDHALVPPGASVGYHRHETVQECYLIINGRGRMRVDGVTADVVAGDCIPNRIGGSHGIVNHTREPLEFLNVAVFKRKGEFDATDLGDDLHDLL